MVFTKPFLYNELLSTKKIFDIKSPIHILIDKN